jgi:hypothetical protein
MITPGGSYSLFVNRKKTINLILIYHQSEKYKIWQALIFDHDDQGSKVQGSDVRSQKP